MRTLIISIATFVLTVFAASSALAHTDDVLARKAKHGGQVRDAGPLHLELVAKPGELILHVSDASDKPVDTQGASANATVLSSKGKASVKLSPAGSNVLKGTGQFEATTDMKVLISITLPGKQAEQARFAPQENR